jgi:hypothetical protein
MSPRVHAPEIQALRQQLTQLRAESRLLQERLAFLQEHPTIGRGLRGEVLIATLLGGSRSERGSSHDLTVGRRGLRIEVKYSGLNAPVRSRPTRRWVWTKPFGESGRKRYERLILVGLADERFRPYYLDHAGPFVLFDVPFKYVRPLTVDVQSGRYSAIYLTTNPLTVRSRVRQLFDHFQVTPDDLRTRYGL